MQVLTRYGWRSVEAVLPQEEVVQAWAVTGGVELEWAQPERASKGDMMMTEARSDTLSMLLAPGQKVLGRVAGLSMLAPLDRLSRQDSVIAGGFIQGGTPLTDRQRLDLRVAVAVQADGSYEEDGKIDLRFLKERKIARMKEVLDAANVPYRVFPRGGDGKTRFSIPAGASQRVKAYLDAGKRLPWAMLGFDLGSRLTILDECVHWDSSVEDGGFRYSTKHQQCADVIQALAASVGLRSRVSEDRVWFRTRVSDPLRCDHPLEKMKMQPLLTPLRAIQVPSGLLLYRYKGTTYVASQVEC